MLGKGGDGVEHGRSCGVGKVRVLMVNRLGSRRPWPSFGRLAHVLVDGSRTTRVESSSRCECSSSRTARNSGHSVRSWKTLGARSCTVLCDQVDCAYVPVATSVPFRLAGAL